MAGYSWSLLICYSDEYLQKMWTVYEVSTFMLLHPGSAIHVRHTWFAGFVIGGMIAVFLVDALSTLLRIPGVMGSFPLPAETAGSLLMAICSVPSSIAIAIMVLKVSRARVKMAERIRHFRFADAKCYNEADRIAVQRNIIAFMKYHGHVENEANDVDIIHTFESKIRSDLPKLFAASLGRAGFPYHFAACIPLPYCLLSIDFACTALHDGFPVKTVCSVLACQMTIGFAGIPLLLATAFIIAGRLAQDSRRGHTRSVCIVSTVAVMFTGVSQLFLNAMLKWVLAGGHAEFGVFVATLACFILATLFLYQPRVYGTNYRRLSQG